MRRFRQCDDVGYESRLAFCMPVSRVKDLTTPMHFYRYQHRRSSSDGTSSLESASRMWLGHPSHGQALIPNGEQAKPSRSSNVHELDGLCTALDSG
jgi:hypothetical protein